MLLALLGCADEVDLDETGSPACDPAPDLAEAEESTAKYADVGLAEGDGYVARPPCEADEAGRAMGVHYIRLAESLDQEVTVASPDILLYVPEGEGVRLVGVEYVVPALVDGALYAEEAEPPAESVAPPPALFCRPFDGPMAGHSVGQPWHHDLHVWLFSENPDGMFAQYNPAESCGGTP